MPFDAASYLAANLDLLQAGVTVQTAEQHYNSFGFRESRSTSFDSTSYLAANSDLLSAGLTTSSAASHYVSYGYRESRSTSFDSTSYLASNTDLLRAGLSTTSAASHYISYGYRESRSTSFDSTSYLASNTDLISAGLTTTSAASHYISYGYTESRSTSFDSATYLASNTDLLQAGLTTTSAASHYISYGYTESRSTSSFNSSAYMLANGLTGISSASQAALNYVNVGYRAGYTTSFDTSTLDMGQYASTYTDLGTSFTSQDLRTTQLLDHYLNYGIYEGRTISRATVTTPQVTLQDTNGSSTGVLSATGERDTFAVTLNAGVEYTMGLRGSNSSGGTLSDPYLRLYDSSNTLLRSDDDSGAGLDSQIIYTPTRTGTYYLSAGAYMDRGTGTYTISTTRPTVTSLLPSTTASISTYRERDSYSVSLDAGNTYRFQMTGSGTASSGATLRDPYLRLYNASGSMVSYNDDGGGNLNANLLYTPSTSGTYRLEAAAYADAGTGTYLLSASRVA